MNCPNCKVYNPEERTVCWRCDAELPKPAQRRTRTRQRSARTWLYLALILFALVTALRMCGAGPAWLQPQAPPSGAAPAQTPIALQPSGLDTPAALQCPCEVPSQ